MKTKLGILLATVAALFVAAQSPIASATGATTGGFVFKASYIGLIVGLIVVAAGVAIAVVVLVRRHNTPVAESAAEDQPAAEEPPASED